MLVELVLVSMLVGALLMLLIQWLAVRWYLSHLEEQETQRADQFPDIYLPQVLKDKLAKDVTELQQKEACIWLNLLGHFLFQELRDTDAVRRWVMRKMNVEFEELLQTTSGKLLAQIIVRDFSLGSTCPVVSGVRVHTANVDEDDVLQCLDIHMHVDYEGCFTLGVDVVLPFNKLAFISVTLRRLSGTAQLQFTRHPYTHWSFSFIQEPDVLFDVESHFEGRTLPQVASLIVNQLRRAIRKKHTLPNYKMRFKPLFMKPEIPTVPCSLRINGQSITVGRLFVTFIKCSRLPLPAQEATLYCVLSADSKPGKELVREQNRVWIPFDAEIIRGQTDLIGMTFKDEYLLDRCGMAVMVDIVQADSAAARADIRKGDVLLFVGTTRISSSKHATKLFKNASEKFTVRLERPHAKLAQEVKFQEESFLLKSGEMEASGEMGVEDGEEFINISVQQSSSDSVLPQADGCNNLNGEGKGVAVSSFGARSRDKSPRHAINAYLSHSSEQMSNPRAGQDVSAGTSSPRLRRVNPVSQTGKEQNSNLSDSPKASLKQGQHSGQTKAPVRKDQSPCRDQPVTEVQPAEKKLEDEVVSCGSMDSDGAENTSTLMKTREVPASQKPRWHDRLTFCLEDRHKYLNACVWYHSLEQAEGKPDRLVSQPQRDLLIGQISLPLNLIVLQCLMTQQGDTQQTLQLQPGEVKAGASRKTWAGRIGFEPQRCYGDITLRFQFIPDNLSQTQRNAFSRDFDPADPSNLEEICIAQESSQDEQASDSEMGSGESRHLFSRTQFNSTTYCKFCGKKIWLKVAFQCSACGMICHKKCIEKCKAETVCSQDGPRKKNAPGEFWRTPVAMKKQLEVELGTQSQRVSRSSRILSKFSKDSSNKSTDKDQTKTNSSPPPSRHAKVKDECESSLPKELHSLHGTLDDAAMNSAKKLGRQLFSQLEISERKARLDKLVNQMQADIDQESAHKEELSLKLQEAETEAARRSAVTALTKSNDKMETLLLLLLQYCSGLQHCLDQEAEQRQQAASSPSASAVAISRAENPSIPSPSRAESPSVLSPQCVQDKEHPKTVSMDVSKGHSPLSGSKSVSRSRKTSVDMDDQIVFKTNTTSAFEEEITQTDEEQKTATVVEKVLTDLIHNAEEDESSSSNDTGNEDDGEDVEKFRPVYQETD